MQYFILKTSDYRDEDLGIMPLDHRVPYLSYLDEIGATRHHESYINDRHNNIIPPYHLLILDTASSIFFDKEARMLFIDTLLSQHRNVIP